MKVVSISIVLLFTLFQTCAILLLTKCICKDRNLSVDIAVAQCSILLHVECDIA